MGGVEAEAKELRGMEVSFVVKGLEVGRWGTYVDGSLVGEKNVTEKGEEVRVEVMVGGRTSMLL